MSNSRKLRFLALGAVTAALYAALTYAAAAMNLAYGPVQFRFSEALTVLPAFTPAAVPGLTLGCFIANLTSPLGIVDWIFGSAATFIAALGTMALSRFRWRGLPILAPLPPVLSNAIIVGLEVSCLSEAGTFSLSAFSPAAFLAGAFSVGIGELAVCFALGIPLMIAIQKTGLERLFGGALA